MPIGPTRILQLWFALPERDRWTEPHFEVTPFGEVPLRIKEGARVRVYAGNSGAIRVQRREHTPVTVLDIELDAERSIDQTIPTEFNGFVYVLAGAISVAGTDLLREGQVGWLARTDGPGDSIVRMVAGRDGARVVLYAGEPQHVTMEAHGPFVGGSRADLIRMSREYVQGRFVRIAELMRTRRRR